MRWPQHVGAIKSPVLGSGQGQIHTCTRGSGTLRRLRGRTEPGGGTTALMRVTFFAGTGSGARSRSCCVRTRQAHAVRMRDRGRTEDEHTRATVADTACVRAAGSRSGPTYRKSGAAAVVDEHAGLLAIELALEACPLGEARPCLLLLLLLVLLGLLLLRLGRLLE